VPQTREQGEASPTSLQTSPSAALPARPPIYDSATQPHPFLEEWQDLWRYRDLVLQWSGRNIKLRYKRSALGVLWTLLEPLMLMLILTVVFSTVFRPMEAFPVYLLAGLILFDFFNRSTLLIVEEIIVSQSLAERVHVPRSAFAVAAVITYLTHWAIAHVPLIAIMLYFNRPFSWALLTLPAGMLLTAMFALGLGLVIATLGKFFHDIRLTYQVLLTGWFYATPVIYPLDVVPENLQAWFRLNPMYLLLRLVRQPVYDGLTAPLGLWAAGIAISVSTLIVGWWTFTHWRNAFDYRS
jgi:ABC-type polysaccharide/polyol phosphate export permease